jgi:hypothetical protein
MLDGHLATIVVGPNSIPPDEWFFDLLGPKGNIATAHGKFTPPSTLSWVSSDVPFIPGNEPSSPMLPVNFQRSVGLFGMSNY